MEKINEFIAAIDRELLKRDITYPKMLLKMSNKVVEKTNTLDDCASLLTDLTTQVNALESAKNCLVFDREFGSSYYKIAFEELVREMDMRLRYYPIMTIRHQITKAEAEIEKRVWRELIEYFNEKFTPSVEVKFLKTRCKIINQD